MQFEIGRYRKLLLLENSLWVRHMVNNSHLIFPRTRLDIHDCSCFIGKEVKLREVVPSAPGF
jgi:hypothetical protein